MKDEKNGRGYYQFYLEYQKTGMGGGDMNF